VDAFYWSRSGEWKPVLFMRYDPLRRQITHKSRNILRRIGILTRPLRPCSVYLAPTTATKRKRYIAYDLALVGRIQVICNELSSHRHKNGIVCVPVASPAGRMTSRWQAARFIHHTHTSEAARRSTLHDIDFYPKFNCWTLA
jgi:hypothetical protein